MRSTLRRAFRSTFERRSPAAVVERLPQPSTPAEAVTVVREHRKAGADLIKLFTGSWVARGKVLPMPTEIARAAAATMHEGGGLVFAHASNVAGLQVALDAGVDVLAHATEDLRGMTQELRARMKRQNVAVIPTLKLFGEDKWLFEVVDEVRDYARSGGQILFGTDVGYLTDYDPTDEYVLMASAGFGWREILASLTTNPAARFSETATRGRIAPGQRGDLVVLEEDPARDVRAFANVRYTIREGALIYSKPRSPSRHSLTRALASSPDRGHRYFFNASFQFRTTVIVDETPSSAVVARRKRWPSAVTA